MATALVSQNVAIRYEQQQNVLEHEAVKQALLMAQVIQSVTEGNADNANHFIADLIRHPMWGLKAGVLWDLAVNNFGRPIWLASLLNHPDKKLVHIGKFLEWLAQPTKELLFRKSPNQ